MANRNQLDAFALVMLAALKAPQSDRNVYVITLWAQSEGVKPYANNPLATTLPWPGATSYNSAGVKVYRTIGDGAQATAATLERTKGQGYEQVIFELKRGNATRWQLYDAINRSGWCRGCQGGFYPNQVYQWAKAPGSEGLPPGTRIPSAPHPPRVTGETGWDYSQTVRNAGREAGRHGQAIGHNAARIRQLARLRGRLHP